MKQARRPLQESNRQVRASRSSASVKTDVKAAIRSTFGDKIAVNASELQKENERKPDIAARKRKVEEREKSVQAGLDRVGPNTPIGKISARIKRMKKENQPQEATKKTITPTSINIEAALIQNIAEVKMIFSQKGISAARHHMEAFPTQAGLGACRTKLSYWTSWIELERSAKDWDRVAELFERARVNVSCADGQHTLQEMFVAFEQEADKLYEEELKRLDQSILETLSDSEDMVSVMTGRPCTNDAPRSITAPKPKALNFFDEAKPSLTAAAAKNKKEKPRMRF